MTSLFDSTTLPLTTPDLSIGVVEGGKLYTNITEIPPRPKPRVRNRSISRICRIPEETPPDEPLVVSLKKKFKAIYVKKRPIVTSKFAAISRRVSKTFDGFFVGKEKP